MVRLQSEIPRGTISGSKLTGLWIRYLVELLQPLQKRNISSKYWNFISHLSIGLDVRHFRSPVNKSCKVTIHLSLNSFHNDIVVASFCLLDLRLQIGTLVLHCMNVAVIRATLRSVARCFSNLCNGQTTVECILATVELLRSIFVHLQQRCKALQPSTCLGVASTL